MEQAPRLRMDEAVACQCDISTGTVMCPSKSRLTPPRISSRAREWP